MNPDINHDAAHSQSFITRREWRCVVLFTLIVIVITTAPYVAAWAGQNADWRFGGMLFGVEDGNSYLGKMRLGARGIWKFHLFYTSEVHDGAPLFYLPYSATGWIVGRFIPPSDPRLAPALMVAFHVLRAVCNAILIPVMYAFIAAFVRSVKTRRLALTLATFGGGLGWLLALTGSNGLFGSLPIDVYVPEGFSFLVLFGLPHIALGRAALLGMLLAIALASERRGGVKLGIAVICGWIAALAVPFYLALAYVILGAWGLAAWITQRRFPMRLFERAVIVGVATLPIFVYFSIQFVVNPAFGVWSSQNNLPSPHALHYVFGCALLVIPALFAVRWLWRRARQPHSPTPSPHGEGETSAASGGEVVIFTQVRSGSSTGVGSVHALLTGWLIAVPILVYLPINVQRRMSEAVIVPLAILAAWGLRFMARTVRVGNLPIGRGIKFALIGAALLTTIFLFSGSLIATTNPGRPLYRPASEIAAFDWLNADAEADAVILSAPETGSAIPVYTPLRTYMGHGPETLYWQDKTETLTRFYRGELTPEERAVLLNPPQLDSTRWVYLPIRYVFYGESERRLAGGSSAWTDGLTLVYDVDGVQIYSDES